MINIKQFYDCDALILGAGPAGAVAAFYLARAGYKVWLVDKQTFPRDKVCGDFVGPVGLLELSRLGITRETMFQQTNTIGSASLFLNGNELVSASIPALPGLPPYGRVIPRKLLDQWIFDAARNMGANVREGYRVTDIHQQDDAVVAVVEREKRVTQIRARVLIGADGSNSIVARKLRGYAPPDRDRIVAVRAYYEGVSGPHDRCDLYFSNHSFPGYCWLFPTGEGTANVGVGVASQTIPTAKRALKSLLQQLVEEDNALSQRLDHAKMVVKVGGWPLTTYDHRLPVVWDRVMLVGDAAGLINPLNGEGIQYALLSGRWAAYYAIQGLYYGIFSKQHFQSYAQTVEQELRYDMAISNMIVQLIRNRTLNPVWLRALEIIGTAAREQPGYASIAGGVLAGLIPASNLLGYQIIGGSIKQAAISLGGDALYQSIKNPVDAVHAGFNLGRSSVKIAFDTMRNPMSTFKWGMDVTSNVAELASQFIKDLEYNSL